jgi:hypothetical protein
MTAKEFEEWAVGAAADWGYSVEVSGVGISNKPSYYPAQDGEPAKPIYASQTAIFRVDTGIALRSPRSVRTVELPFMRGSHESAHPHRLAAKNIHPTTSDRPKAALPPSRVADVVKAAFSNISVPNISLAELWGLEGVAVACAGSQRHLVGSLGGFGDCPKIEGASSDFVVIRNENGLAVTRR